MTLQSVVVAATVLGLSVFPSTSVAQQSGRAAMIQAQDPDISIFQRSEAQTLRQTIDFSATPNSYVVVIRVGARGAVEVLFPLVPSVDKSLVKSNRIMHVPELNASAKTSGAVYGFVSRTPFVFSKVSSENGWNSLHLANYSGSTEQIIAQTFGSEIADEASRVIMARATPGGSSLVTRGYTQSSRLASFRNKPCPYLATPTAGSSGTTDCLIYGMRLPGTGVQTRSQQAGGTKQGKGNE